ncbi:MAG TPA: alkaline phosphatase family protein [Gemmatimonadaceae bacterium]|nr:alkaline phosphatase family protein [Gemmatimonadaceae bacterium]
MKLHVSPIHRAVLATVAAMSAVVSAAGAQGAKPAVPGAPHAKAVTIVIFENRDFANIVGSKDAPYLNATLVPQAAVMTNSHATAHPSQPNYLELFSGNVQGVTGDECPETSSAPNIATQLLAAHQTFRGYAESMPNAGFTGCDGSKGLYRRKHNPWADFTNVPASLSVPLEWSPASLAMIVPNMCNDMHDCSTTVGDTWMKQNLPAIMKWDAAHDGLLIVTWDEAAPDADGTNHIATLLIGPMIKPGRYTQHIDHDDVLRTIEQIYGLPCIANACGKTGIAGVWR